VLIAQVHDELVFDCPPQEIDAVRALVQKEMTEAIDLNVKLTAEVNIGRNWAEAK
jgi:DNA polymerase-1